MPNLRSSFIDPNPASMSATVLELVASDGRSFSLTAQQVADFFQAQTGSRPSRVTKTLDWVRAGIEAALGPEQVPAILVDLEWDDVRGNLRNVSVRS